MVSLVGEREIYVSVSEFTNMLIQDSSLSLFHGRHFVLS